MNTPANSTEETKNDIATSKEFSPQSETYIDSYGITRKTNETLKDRAKLHFSNVLNIEEFDTFFNITPAEKERVLKVCDFFHQLSFGLHPEFPNSKDLQLYDKVLDKYASCPLSSPHFILPK
jgi:hypothetical protein